MADIGEYAQRDCNDRVCGAVRCYVSTLSTLCAGSQDRKGRKTAETVSL